jgi:uncharacterized protein (DUF1697 family)
MTVVCCLFRAVNVGGNNKIAMRDLLRIFETLKLPDARSFIQSGNVVCRSPERNLDRLKRRIEDAVEKEAGFRPEAILRTTAELREVVQHSPFANRPGIEPAKLAVVFLARSPEAEAAAELRALDTNPEELHLRGRELYIYYPDGMGRSKLPPRLDRTLGTSGTARNWNTVTKLLAMAEELESS